MTWQVVVLELILIKGRMQITKKSMNNFIPRPGGGEFIFRSNLCCLLPHAL